MKKTLHLCIDVLAVCLVVLLAVLVRSPAAYLAGTSHELREEFMNETGQIYMMEMDSYYHTRITDNFLEKGSLGNSVSEKGKPWDSVSYYPEGRTAEYQPGIVYLTTTVWKILNRLTGISLYEVELWIAAVMAALSGAVAFLFVRRISNTAGGFVAGILVSCQSVFVERTFPGRYDTDMFVVLMDVLLIFLFARSLKAETRRRRWISFAGFAMTVLIYTMCWSRYSVLLGLLSVMGGFLYLLVLFFRYMVQLRKDRRSTFKNRSSQNSTFRSGVFKSGFFRQPEVGMFLICVCMAAGLILLAKGPDYIIGAFKNVIPTKAAGQSAADPDIFSSIVELETPAIFPQQFTQWMLSYIPGHKFTVLNGLGGLPVVVLCIGGLVLLIFRTVLPEKSRSFISLSRRESALYFCLLTVWIAGCFIATRRGTRFIEHLGVPTGLAAGLLVGWIVPDNTSNKPAVQIANGVVSMIICVAAVILPLSGALTLSRFVQPAVTDASARAMDWIKDNAESTEAVIASWWDMGYYFEDASGHPAFWDGGSQTGTRAILISKALTTHDPIESKKILQMLANAGDWPADWLKRRMGGKKAFEALWKILPLEKNETITILMDEYGLDQNQASTIERKVHPSEEKEIYLVLTGTMMDMLGWFEYYADWDFDGNNRKPYATVHYISPDGTEVLNSQQKNLTGYFKERSEETIWNLFLNNGDQQSVFSKVYESSDAFTKIQVWKV